MNKNACNLELTALAGPEVCPVCGCMAAEHSRHAVSVRVRDLEAKALTLAEHIAKSTDYQKGVLADFLEVFLDIGPPDDILIQAAIETDQVDQLLEIVTGKPGSVFSEWIREYSSPLVPCLDEAGMRIEQANEKHGPFASFHELESVLREEVAEVTAEVFAKCKFKRRIRDELIDVAVVALRAVYQIDFGRPFSDEQKGD